MAAINEAKLTREQILKAMACETPEELIALAKAGGLRDHERRGGGVHSGAFRLRAGRGSACASGRGLLLWQFFLR